MSMKIIGWGIGIGGVLLTAVVTSQDIKYPWAPSELVQLVSENSVAIIHADKKWLNRELLNNRVSQQVFIEDGENVPDVYLQQEQGFIEDIEKRDRQLRELEGK